MSKDKAPTLYHYHPETLEFVGSSEAKIDPLETKVQGKNIYLKPAYCTETPPIKFKENENVIYEDSRWKKVKDFRGKVFYDKNNIEYHIDKLDVSPEKDWSEEPNEIEPSYADKRRLAILEKYSVTDQLDAILKAFVQLRMDGVDMPQDIDDLIGHWTKVKKDIPKET
jgi:hypothetical protein